ncbi:class I SAM-dependent methyltransferase [Streptomyces longwoodensis]|uniref:class I SAM-dependent methyltransferase n=1 Tax=Streptomyces longwoodensis TaxID=68231 RepID=UPI00224CFC39|nr:class I SAM-dependent methyltransferase [Streptomyces longwoodensis]MCX4995537.1 class I SAM-dependent methyltransferase [Streptomyces longwoodensis]WUC71691.1 class I SAM-dependent methyltransferase [Streptomyces longwoodensis]
MTDSDAGTTTTRADLADALRAARDSYDTIAEDYTEEHPDGLGDGPLYGALLTAFADLVKEAGGGPVADVGSGPGYVTARLHALGVPVFGVDVSPRMVALARRAHPHLRFHVGSMTALDLPDATLGGISALYSIIHVPDEHLPAVFAEFRRVLAPGGHVMLLFQFEEDLDGRHLAERYGRPVDLRYHWRTPDTVAGLLTGAGLEVRARAVLAPEGPSLLRMPRGYVLARRPA